MHPTLDAGNTISTALTTYRNHAGVLLPLAFGLFAIQALAALVLGSNLVGVAVALILGTILGILFQGAVVELARDVEDGTLDSSVGQLLSSVVPAIVPLFLVGLLSGLAIAVGLVFLIVPGVILMVLLAVVGPVTVIERPGVIAAMTRSRELVKGSGGPVFGLILFNLLLSVIASSIGSAGGDNGAGVLLTWIASSLVAPATALVIATAYLRLRDVHGEAPIPTGVATPDGPRPI